MLDPRFARWLESDSRTAWARDLNDDQIVGLLWALDEFACRNYLLAGFLDQFQAHIDPSETDFARARAVLQRLADLVSPRGSRARGRKLWSPEAWRHFSAEFHRELELGKYTRWARNITEEHFFDILATAAEFAPFAHHIVKQLDRHKAEIYPNVAPARAMTALQLIAETVRGKRFSRDEVITRIQLAKRNAGKR